MELKCVGNIHPCLSSDNITKVLNFQEKCAFVHSFCDLPRIESDADNARRGDAPVELVREPYAEDGALQQKPRQRRVVVALKLQRLQEKTKIKIVSSSSPLFSSQSYMTPYPRCPSRNNFMLLIDATAVMPSQQQRTLSRHRVYHIWSK